MKKEKKVILDTEKENIKKNSKVVKKDSKKSEMKDVEKKKKKKNIFSKIVGYFKGVKKEISRIRWTKGKELVKYSVAAVSFILFFCVYFYVIDILVALLRSSL